MKNRLKHHKHLTALLAVIVLAVCLSIYVSFALGLFVLGMWQLFEFATSKGYRRGVVFVGALTDEQAREFEDVLMGLQKKVETWDGLTGRTSDLEKRVDDLRGQLRKMLRTGIHGAQNGVRWVGNVPFVTDDCARAMTSILILGAESKGHLDSILRHPEERENLKAMARDYLGLQTKAALTTTEIPVPTIYVPQIVELVFKYGQARQFARVFPLGAGTVKLPRLKAGEDDFGYLGAGTAGMSQAIPEKKVTAELVTFTANKFGGIIRIPYELEEDTFVPLGQFLARYIARQLAKGEDKTLFLADGTAAYAEQTGIGPYCAANPDYLLKLAAGSTKVSDITLDDLRQMRGLVNAAVLANMDATGGTAAAYYLHPSLEPLLRSFNKYPNFVVFTNENGRPMFDGWPIRWIGVSAVNNQQAQPGQFPAFFGDLSYWYLGERGQVRVEVSKEVFFASDELAMRALERIDVEAMAEDAMSALQLPNA